MENGKNKVTTKKQFEKLVELMEKFPEVGRGKPQFGNSKLKIKELWESVALQLNCLGPPSRTAYEWGRVWIHYKASLKKKLANNRNNYLATGGGPSQEQSLSPMEESVAQLIQLREAVAPSGSAFGVENIPPTVADVPLERSPLSTPVVQECPTPSRTVQLRRANNCMESERLQLLSTQAETQQQILKKIGQLEKTVHKSYTLQKEALDLKKRKMEIYERKANEAHELHALKTEVQRLKIAKLKSSQRF
ncbi:uncharacterized protein LOC125778972 [Bactrocera dorsalis]|uniref:Regulatory protein zeste n=1 Tax=Bactrocera dorsalis TaxID=27457 RepID=A0ABM3K074_BACDO|nr:uncharacterized protein LOC125778972 [Bactrocera dorsalis]